HSPVGPCAPVGPCPPVTPGSPALPIGPAGPGPSDLVSRLHEGSAARSSTKNTGEHCALRNIISYPSLFCNYRGLRRSMNGASAGGAETATVGVAVGAGTT